VTLWYYCKPFFGSALKGRETRDIGMQSKGHTESHDYLGQK